MESALMISAGVPSSLRRRATSTARPLFPEAVGPVMAISGCGATSGADGLGSCGVSHCCRHRGHAQRHGPTGRTAHLGGAHPAGVSLPPVPRLPGAGAAQLILLCCGVGQEVESAGFGDGNGHKVPRARLIGTLRNAEMYQPVVLSAAGEPAGLLVLASGISGNQHL